MTTPDGVANRAEINYVTGMEEQPLSTCVMKGKPMKGVEGRLSSLAVQTPSDRWSRASSCMSK